MQNSTAAKWGDMLLQIACQCDTMGFGRLLSHTATSRKGEEGAAAGRGGGGGFLDANPH